MVHNSIGYMGDIVKLSVFRCNFRTGGWAGGIRGGQRCI